VREPFLLVCRATSTPPGTSTGRPWSRTATTSRASSGTGPSHRAPVRTASATAPTT